MIQEDTQGNKIGIMEDGVHLKLARTLRVLKIFNIKNGQLSKWVSPKNILRKANAVGFNHKALQMLQNAGYTALSLHIGKKPPIGLKIADILESGDFLWFKQQGFERQIFWKL